MAGNTSNALLLSLLPLAAVVVAACGGAPAPAAQPAEASGAPVATLVAELSAAPPAVQPTGQLEIRATDSPSYEILLFTVRDIEVRLAGPGEPHTWISVIPGETTIDFDVRSLALAPQVLGTHSEFPAAAYDAVRMQVVGVSTRRVQPSLAPDPLPTPFPVPLSVEVDQVRVDGPFEVDPGIKTILTLDFDLARSITVSEDGRVVVFDPVVELLVSTEPQP